MHELYKKHRPKNTRQLIGQDSAVEQIDQWIEDDSLPHTILLTGPSGVGKTTVGRILRHAFECGDADYQELNTADARGIDKVREIRGRMHAAPMSGSSRIWLLDEVHKWTSDSQHAMLKILEDTPSHVYFFLATTNPEKLLRTIRTRCTELVLKALTDKDQEKLIKKICIAEKKKIPTEVIQKIIDNSDGSARQALVHLNSVISLSGKAKMLEAIQSSVVEIQSREIARALFRKGTTWKQMAGILKKCLGEEPEQIRWSVLGYARSVLLTAGQMSGRAYLVIDAFQDHFYDSKHAGLAAACYEVLAEN